MLPARGIWGLLARVLDNSYKDTFLVRLGTSLLLTKFGIAGPVADFIGIFARGLIGLLVETGIYKIDLAIVALREGMKLKEFEREAEKAYLKATAKLYNEAQKNEIRKEYLELIASFGNVGDRPL